MAAILYTWWEKHQADPPNEPQMSWDEFVSIWLRDVTVPQMAVVNRSLEVVLGDGWWWSPWPLGSDSPNDVIAIPPLISISIKDSTEAILEILDVMDVHQRWLALPTPRPVHPLVAVMNIQQSTRDEALISNVNNMTRIPYAASEVLRRSWREDRDENEVELNGNPLADYLRVLPPGLPRRRLYVDSPTLVDSSGRLRLNTSESRNIYLQDARQRAVPMVAWPRYDSPLRQDLWLLLTVVYGSTSAILWTEEDGARLLARNKYGRFRKPEENDFERWRTLWVYAHHLEIWYSDKQGSRFVKVVYVYPLDNGLVSIDKPTWHSESEGRFTLIGAVHRARYVGERRGYSRLIGCMEYWLARSFDGTPGVASLLRPARGKDGPGPWAPSPSGGTDWWTSREVLEVLLSEQVNKETPNAARKRYRRMMDGLQAAGYLRRGAAGNGDAVEVETIPRRRGVTPTLRFRATARFCEAARLAHARSWSTTPLPDWLRLNDSADADITDTERTRRRELRERRKALTLEQVEEALRRCNNKARAERELGVGGSGSEPGNYLRGWLKRKARGGRPAK